MIAAQRTSRPVIKISSALSNSSMLLNDTSSQHGCFRRGVAIWKPCLHWSHESVQTCLGARNTQRRKCVIGSGLQRSWSSRRVLAARARRLWPHIHRIGPPHLEDTGGCSGESSFYEGSYASTSPLYTLPQKANVPMVLFASNPTRCRTRKDEQDAFSILDSVRFLVISSSSLKENDSTLSLIARYMDFVSTRRQVRENTSGKKSISCSKGFHYIYSDPWSGCLCGIYRYGYMVYRSISILLQFCGPQVLLGQKGWIKNKSKDETQSALFRER